nr:uncharacterized protein LOC110382819 [Helicoverpa armigera]
MKYIVPVLVGLLTFDAAHSHVLKRDVAPLSDEQSYRKNSPSAKPQRRSGSNEETNGNSLESVVLAIDTGVKKFMEAKSKPDVIDGIAKSLVDLAKNSVDTNYRAKGQGYDLKPEIIHFRANKPSVMFELNSKSIISVLKDLLKSKTVHKYMDTFSKEAAVIFRTFKHEMDKVQRSKAKEQ